MCPEDLGSPVQLQDLWLHVLRRWTSRKKQSGKQVQLGLPLDTALAPFLCQVTLHSAFPKMQYQRAQELGFQEIGACAQTPSSIHSSMGIPHPALWDWTMHQTIRPRYCLEQLPSIPIPSLLEMKFLIKIFRGVWAVSGVTLAGAPGNIYTSRYKNPGQLYVTRKYYLSSLKNT